MSPSRRQVEDARAIAAKKAQGVADLAVRICQVPGPTGHEIDRARLVAQVFQDAGYRPEIDDIGNVYARRGSRGGRVLMLAAHTDTVFPASVPITAMRENGHISGPGIGDNSLGVAAMIGTLTALDELGIDTPYDIVAAATVGEEGLGNLRGIRQAVGRYRDELAGVIAIEGHRLGRISRAAVGSVRWKVTVTGPGGHSWGAFGKPSAIHGLGRIIAEIAALEVPTSPKATYNVGLVDGGTSVNTIAASACAVIDMRSADPASLNDLVDRIGKIADTAAGEGLTVDVEVLGERPAGAMPADHPFVRAAAEVLGALGVDVEDDASSTDANIPISLGIPALCVGVSRGDGAHTVTESMQVEPIATGLAQLILLAAGDAT
jgi:acetylornithine deacetylase/succinyl-diaminopimelate desuccinylase-like protein